MKTTQRRRGGKVEIGRLHAEIRCTYRGYFWRAVCTGLPGARFEGEARTHAGPRDAAREVFTMIADHYGNAEMRRISYKVYAITVSVRASAPSRLGVSPSAPGAGR